jgi:hypothetical protein
MTRKLKRSRKPKPKHSPPTPVAIPDDWSDQQALAVYDFCSALQELIWRRYHDALIDPILHAQLEAGGPHRIDTRTFPLPFDDDAPF